MERTLMRRDAIPSSGETSRRVRPTSVSWMSLSVAWMLAACESDRVDMGSAPAKSTVSQASTVAATSASAETPVAKPSVRYGGTVALKKQDIGLDPGVKVRAWATDDGKQYQGDCKLEVELADGGQVKGALKGCELELDLNGAHEDRVATASLESPSTSFSGTLLASLADQDGKPRLKGELWIANGDATIARKGVFDLPAL